MKEEQIIALIEGYGAGTLTPQEEKLFLDWYRRADLDEFNRLFHMSGIMDDNIDHYPAIPGEFQERLEADLDRYQAEEEIEGNKPRRAIPIWSRVAAAAVVFIMLSAGTYFLFFNKKAQNPADAELSHQFKNDVLPGGNKAILTLGNGSTIILDSVHSGTLTLQGNAKIVKLDSGRLAYNSTSEKPTEILYNVLTTPRGGQFQVTLPDGSKVWLNAASSIRYPTAFTGKDRKVEITGEAYFEITHNAKQPFIVQVGTQGIQDIGTSFNVNAYPDEPAVATTLLQGSIRIIKGDKIKELRPGQQAITKEEGDIRVLDNVDMDAVVAWKNGKFQFGQSAGLAEIMRQLGRWYDVEIDYDGNVPDQHFGGEMPRNSNLSQVLEILKTSGVRFNIEGKKLIVSP